MNSALHWMRHRGPDDQRVACEGETGVGHTRLAIIDLEASLQPMKDPSGRFTLSYNGEIYNFVDLRKYLEAHWHFKTRGDTEVLLAGLILEGEAFTSKLQGMWAFAFWDKMEQRLLLSRDRMGKKPLYYYQAKERFACASELKVLRALVAEPLREDLDSTADYLRYGYYLPGTTAYQQVYELLPGHNLCWKQGSETESKAYWSLDVDPFNGSRIEACDQLREALIAAVRKRMVADVEVGAFLSGGVDSSLITGIMQRYCGVSPKTFTIGFNEGSYDERDFARLVASHFETDHYEACLEKWDPDVLKDLVFNHIGQPFADSSMLPTALVSRLAGKHVKVSLSGDGGDELFSGYQRYQARAIMRWYTRLPAMLRANIARVIKAIPEPMAHHSRNLVKKAHLFQDIVDRTGDETPYVAPLMYSRARFNELAPDLVNRGHRARGLPETAGLDDVQSMMIADAQVYLPQDILVKVDRASMAHSLEVRAPFLDQKVVELAFSFPRRWHRCGMSGKRMLRRSFADLLPDTIWRRRKQGFGVPIHQWFRGTLDHEMRDLLADNHSPLSSSFINELMTNHKKMIRDHGHRLWNIYVYLLWNRNQISGF